MAFVLRKGRRGGIKVSPVGGPTLCSDAPCCTASWTVSRRPAWAPRRHRLQPLPARNGCGIDKWLPAGVRMEWGSPDYNDIQLDMDGYDPDHYMEMALIKPGENWSDPHFRRSYVAKTITRQSTSSSTCRC